MSLTLEYAKDDRGRVTAGIPSLDSSRRRDITEYHLRQIYQQSLQAEYRGNEEKATSPDGDLSDVTDWEQVVGIPLTGARLATRLHKLNPSLWFEQSNSDPAKSAVYHLKNDLKGGLTKEFICGYETEWNPEFSLRVVDDEGKAKGIISGWRRLLAKLIRARLISEPKAFTIFGPPSRDSENWARFTQ